MTLEPRILYSVSPLADVEGSAELAIEPESSLPITGESNFDESGFGTLPRADSDVPVRHVIVIDSELQDVELNDPAAMNSSLPKDAVVHRLGTTDDPFSVIGHWLERYQNLQSVHIVSH